MPSLFLVDTSIGLPCLPNAGKPWNELRDCAQSAFFDPSAYIIFSDQDYDVFSNIARRDVKNIFNYICINEQKRDFWLILWMSLLQAPLKPGQGPERPYGKSIVSEINFNLYPDQYRKIQKNRQRDPRAMPYH